MCGIVGFINSRAKIDLSVIAHRGPDSQGVFENEFVTFGHTRLSIQDTSDASYQPFISECGNYVLVYNGEIYNHKEIRKSLEKNRSVRFRTLGDTETVMHALITHGRDALEMFNGIFALAFYDISNGITIIARDRFGVKPLYYGAKNNSFAFASEIKALRNWEFYDGGLSLHALESYVRFLWSPGRETPLSNILKVLPGEYITIYHTGNTKSDFYYRRRESPKIKTGEKEIISNVDKLLTEAVERQLLSDVPIGFFLSGGLDSSLIVAIARKLNPSKKITCFTIKTSEFAETEGFTNDLYYARKVARHLNVELIEVDCSEDLLGDFDFMVWHLDEPQADAAPLNVYNISREARRLGFKVLLGGTAGDDLFSGYRRHKVISYIKAARFVPPICFRCLGFLMSFFSNRWNWVRRVNKLLRSFQKNRELRVYSLFEWLDFNISSGLFKLKKPNSLRFEYFEEVIQKAKLRNPSLEDVLTLEKSSFLVDHNLNYTDKMGMAAGVEIRVPFLDNDLEEFSCTIPEDLKIKNGETKYILKKVAERYLPREIIYRPKTGFGAPMRKWITDTLQSRIEEDLSAERLMNQGIFDHKRVDKLIQKNLSGKLDASYSIWALLSIQSWIKQFTDNK